MAFDLAGTPRTDIIVQASGDAHLSNFGLFASPERTLVFDANDFDETLPGPWEWDVKRLAASMVIAGRANGFSAGRNREAAMSAGPRVPPVDGAATPGCACSTSGTPRSRTRTSEAGRAYAACSRARLGSATRVRALEAVFTKARRRDGLKAFELPHRGRRRTPGHRRRPARGQHSIDLDGETLQKVFTDYRATLAENRREFLERYRFVDFALKVVGVGQRRDPLLHHRPRGSRRERPAHPPGQGGDRLRPGAVHRRRAGAANHGERVVVGQRLMQATPDILLGWTRGPGGRDFYFRQLWDMKGSVDTTTLRRPGSASTASLCGGTLARAHARSGDAVAIAAYLGTSDTFDGAIADFAEPTPT